MPRQSGGTLDPFSTLSTTPCVVAQLLDYAEAILHPVVMDAVHAEIERCAGLAFLAFLTLESASRFGYDVSPVAQL